MTIDKYSSFAALLAKETEGIDFSRTLRDLPESQVAIIAPHGGGIEFRTSEVATAIAGQEHCLYIFEGIKSAGNYASLHITSSRFDDPQCLSLIAQRRFVVAVHGCRSKLECIYLGGLNQALIDITAVELERVGINVQLSGHKFPGKHALNICNRGLTQSGMQLELTTALRQSPQLLQRTISAVRAAVEVTIAA